ncbi:hypothetical protein CPC08DRAFT_824867, partial [Agrocybe pediades]
MAGCQAPIVWFCLFVLVNHLRSRRNQFIHQRVLTSDHPQRPYRVFFDLLSLPHSMSSTDVNIIQDQAHDSSLCLRGDGGYSHACREIANLEREADVTSKKLAEIFERLEYAKSKANHIRSTMLAKLPNEILSLIFCEAWSAVDPSPRERDRFHYYEKQQEETRLSVALLVAG